MINEPVHYYATRARPKRRGEALTEEGQELRSLFLMNTTGCTCFQCAPCGACTHPGNTLNLEENDDVWRPLTEQETRATRVKRRVCLDD